MAKINYEHKTWYDKNDTANASKRIPISATHLNRIEDGIQESFDKIAYSNFKNLVIQKISSSCEWTAPKAAENTFRVFCVGGGGSGGYYSRDNDENFAGGGGGGGGYIQILDVNVEPGTKIDVICGAGGENGQDGGATSFGAYITAEGGTSGESGKYADNIYIAGNGGSGGSGGGGGGSHSNYSTTKEVRGGNGGNGGLYGGGGGAGGCYSKRSNTVKIYSKGGTSEGCGNGGTPGVVSTMGKLGEDPIINCLFQVSYLKDVNTTQSEAKGSGGINSNGGTSTDVEYGAGGGGGGYCGNGGDADRGAGGGGGGYCGNGGSGSSSKYYYAGGGGGGFFCDGGNGNYSGGGGGGFFSSGSNGQGSNTGKGGNGGVLVMYVKDDTEEEA